MKTIYQIGMISGLAFILGCKPKLLLEKAPREFIVNSAGELSYIMNGFGTAYNHPGIRSIDVPKHPTFEIQKDVDRDGVQDIAFRAGDIWYHREAPDIVYYVIHTSELSIKAKEEYLREVNQLKQKNGWKSSDVYDIGLNEIKLRYPMRWHKHILNFDEYYP